MGALENVEKSQQPTKHSKIHLQANIEFFSMTMNNWQNKKEYKVHKMNKNPDNSSWVDGAKLKAQTPFVYLYI